MKLFRLQTFGQLCSTTFISTSPSQH